MVQLHRLLFFLSGGIFVVSTIIVWALYSWDSVRSDWNVSHRWLHLALTCLFGAFWFFGTFWRLAGSVLLVIDAAGLMLTSLVLAVMTAGSDTGHGGAMELVAAILVILAARAALIPSSGTRTFILSSAASTLSILSFTWMAAYHPVSGNHLLALSLRDTAITMVLWLGLMVATVAMASRIIFGLQREIRVARQIGQYELVEKIGAGGMGVVYRARHALLRRETAIKLLPDARLSPERMARFEREVTQTARLTHPNTVAVFDYGRTPEGVFYYAMEYLDGIDLECLVSFTGALPVARALYLLRQILSSLIEAHEMGLVHRDIKPANVILTERGGEADVVKVVDFGLVKDLRGADQAGLTAASSITGTPLYLAPESIRSADTAGPSCDIYAVAALAYYLVTGTQVFNGSTVLEICAHHLHSLPDPPSTRVRNPLQPEIDQLILRGLAKQPEDRYPSARAFRDAVDALDALPRWTEVDARLWWAQNREQVRMQRSSLPLDEQGRTVAVDLEQRKLDA